MLSYWRMFRVSLLEQHTEAFYKLGMSVGRFLQCYGLLHGRAFEHGSTSTRGLSEEARRKVRAIVFKESKVQGTSPCNTTYGSYRRRSSLWGLVYDEDAAQYTRQLGIRL